MVRRSVTNYHWDDDDDDDDDDPGVGDRFLPFSARRWKEGEDGRIVFRNSIFPKRTFPARVAIITCECGCEIHRPSPTKEQSNFT